MPVFYISDEFTYLQFQSETNGKHVWFRHCKNPLKSKGDVAEKGGTLCWFLNSSIVKTEKHDHIQVWNNFKEKISELKQKKDTEKDQKSNKPKVNYFSEKISHKNYGRH